MDAIIAAFSVVMPYAFLLSLRVGTAFATLPAPFGDVAPMRVRATLGVLVALALVAPMFGTAEAMPVDPVLMVRAGLGEAAVGAVIGLTVRMALSTAEIAGTIAGTSMGLGFATSVDPMFGDEALPTSRLLASLAALIFFVLDGHHIVLAAVSATIRVAPIGDGFRAIRAENLVHIGSGLISQGLRIAAPVVATMFIVQVGTALVAKAAPRVQVFGLTFALTTSIGLVALYFATPGIAYATSEFLSQLPTRIDAMFIRP